MRTEHELKQLAVDIVEGKVFGTWNLNNPDMVGSVFMGMNFMTQKQADDLQAKEVAHFYEYLDKAGPMSVNGMPTFFSMNYLNKQEAGKLQTLIEDLKRQKAEFLGVK